MGRVSAFREPELLSDVHQVSSFESGKSSLDGFLLNVAAISQRDGFARTFVVSDDHHRVVAYYALCGAAISRSDAPRQIAGHGAPGEVPVVLLARLAVHLDFQGQGLGTILLHHAFKSSLASARTVAFRALMVHALDDQAAEFYLKFGFRPARNSVRTLLLGLGDVAHILENVPQPGE